MRRFILIPVFFLILSSISAIQVIAADGSGQQKDSAHAFLSKSEGSVVIRMKGESMSLGADNAPLEEILQKIAEEAKVILSFYCEDPALDQKRTSGVKISGSTLNVLGQLLSQEHRLNPLNEEGKAVEGEKGIAAVNIYPKECNGTNPPVRVFTSARQNPLLRKVPEDVSLKELGGVLMREGPASRRRVLELLRMKGDEKGIPYAQEALKDENPGVILAAANTLKVLGRKHGFEKVAGAIYARFEEKSYGEFLPIMAEVDKERLWAIIDRFMDQAGEGEKSIIVRALFLTDDRRAIKYLSRISSGTTETSRSAIKAIAKIGGPEASTTLVGLLRGTDIQKQAWAAQAAHILSPNEGMEVRSEVEKIVSGDHVSEELLQGLVEVNYLAPMEKLMKSPTSKPELKIRALKAMANKGTEKTIEVISPGLKEKSPQVRLASVEALGAIAADEAIPGLLTAIGDEEAAVRTAAVRALSRFYVDDPIVLALGKAIQDADENVRRPAVDSMSMLGKPNETMTAILKDCENHKDPYIARKAGAVLKYWQLK